MSNTKSENIYVHTIISAVNMSLMNTLSTSATFNCKQIDPRVVGLANLVLTSSQEPRCFQSNLTGSTFFSRSESRVLRKLITRNAKRKSTLLSYKRHEIELNTVNLSYHISSYSLICILSHLDKTQLKK